MATMSFISRILNGSGDAKLSGEPTAMITRDLLGAGRLNSLVHSSKYLDLDLDLDVHVPSGWEKRLDLKSGKLYINRCNSMNSSSSSSKTQDNNNKKVNYTTTPSQLQQLNSNMSEQETNIDLNLLLSPTPPAPSPVASSSTFHSVVCTLEKVKSALERADRAEEASRNIRMKRETSVSMMSTSSHSSSFVKASDERLMKEEEEEEEKSSSASAMYAASCRNCLLYVLVFKNNPKCPRCNVTVPSPTALKKPLIDLNISL